MPLTYNRCSSTDHRPTRWFVSLIWSVASSSTARHAAALASAMAPRLDDMAWFAGLLDETLNVEMTLHRSYCEEFGIGAAELEATVAAPSNLAYTSFLLKAAHQGSFGELVASLLPCQWGYWEIGSHLMEKGLPQSAPLYAQWIEMYTSQEFADLAEHLRAMADRIGQEAGPSELAAMTQAYETSIRLEYGFWDMAYGMERWRV